MTHISAKYLHDTVVLLSLLKLHIRQDWQVKQPLSQRFKDKANCVHTYVYSRTMENISI